MTQNNTSYREQGRAVFLAAIMVFSVVAASAAFAGTAAADEPREVDGTDLSGIIYAGENLNVTINNAGDATFQGTNGNEAYLVEVTSQGDNGNIQSVTAISSYSNVSSTSGEAKYEDVDTAGLDSGTYAIANSSTTTGSFGTTETFSVQTQSLDASWDSDSVDETDNGTFVELDTSRNFNSNYNVTISADGLSADQIDDIFAGGGSDGDFNATVSSSAHIPYDALGYDRDDDTRSDIRDDGYVTVDLGELNNRGLFSSDELTANFSRLERLEGLPDAGSYEFNFRISDSDATSSASVNIAESDEDADFETGASTSPAGDIAEFNLTLTDTDDMYVQIGDEESDFVDVLYIKEDESAPITVRINTRLLGTSADKDAVYDTDNTDVFQSEIHGGIDEHPEAPLNLYGEDGDDKTNDFNNYVNDLLDTDADDQLTRPLQATDYQIIAAGTAGLDGNDEAVFDSDPGGEANNQLDSKTLTLSQPEIGGVTVHTAPEDDADATTDVEDLVGAATPRNEVAINDRLVVQVEATGIYGAMIANGSGNDADVDWDRLEDGVTTDVLDYLVDRNSDTSEYLDFSVEAESATGNTDPLSVRLDDGSSDSDAYVVLDEDNGQFFLIADTSSDSAFENGPSPDSDRSFTASLTYDADNDDNRYEFASGANPNPFNSDDESRNYPYLLEGDTLSGSSDLTLAPRQITFDNQNADELVQAQATEEAEISGTTNVAPGSDAELRISSTDASSSFRQGNDLNITEDGSITTTYSLADQEVGDEFQVNYRVSGSSVDSADGIIVEAIGDAGDGEETNETDTDDGEDMDDGEEEPADDGETNESADGGDDGSTDDGTPGFGAVVALIALIGAALLAVRRQN